MNTTRGQVLAANVYQACNDEYRNGVVFNREKLFSSPQHVVKVRGDKLDILIDKDAEDTDEIFQSKGTAISPDEILNSIKPSGLKIPVKYREDFTGDTQLPSSELLKVLHYYASKKFANEPESQRMTRSMDETALLAMGMMVEQWVDDLVNEEGSEFFLEEDDTQSVHGEEQDDKDAIASENSSSSDSN